MIGGGDKDKKQHITAKGFCGFRFHWRNSGVGNKATASQFDSGNIEIVRIPYVTEEEHIDDILSK